MHVFFDIIIAFFVSWTLDIISVFLASFFSHILQVLEDASPPAPGGVDSPPAPGGVLSCAHSMGTYLSELRPLRFNTCAMKERKAGVPCCHPHELQAWQVAFASLYNLRLRCKRSEGTAHS